MRLLSVFLLCAFISIGAYAQSYGTGTVSGLVVNAATGEPLRRARVDLNVFENPNMGASAPTDGAGRFTLHGIPAGKFVVHAWHPGFAQLNYGAAAPGAPGEVIVLTTGEHREGVNFRLPALGVITGVVFDPDGTPLQGALVHVWQRSYTRGKPSFREVRSGNTDDHGRFRVFNLLAGAYVISADMPFGRDFGPRGPAVTFIARGHRIGEPAPRPDALSYRETFYPGSATAAGAATVTVASQQPVEGIEIRLAHSREATVSGQIVAPVRLDQTSRVQMNLRSMSGDGRRPSHWRGVMVQGDHFEAPGVPEGEYILSASTTIQGHAYSGSQRVEVTDAGLNGLTVRLLPNVNIAGALTIEGGSPSDLANTSVTLSSGSEDTLQQRELRANVGSDGKFQIANVPAGTWDIGVHPIPKNGFIKAMTLGEYDVLRNEMKIESATTAPLRIVISTRGGEVTGTVQGRKTSVVLLAPEGRDARVFSFYEMARLDDEGRFDIRGVTPGMYKLYAFTQLSRNDWLDPDFLQKYRDLGVGVQVSEGQTTKQDLAHVLEVYSKFAPETAVEQP